MGAGIDNVESKAKVCGIVILLGAVICLIPLFTFVKYAFRGESQYAFLFLIRNLACIAGYAAIGFGIFAEKHDYFKIGLFINAGAFVLDTYFPLMWITSETKYYESLSRGLGSGNFLLLLCDLAALAGFVLMGILFSQKPEWQFPKVGSIAMTCIASYIVLMLIYILYYISEHYLKLGEYLSSYITGSSALAIVGAIGVLLMPYAFSDEIPQVEILDMINSNQNTAKSSQNIGASTAVAGNNTAETVAVADNATETASMESEQPQMLETDIVNLLRKYKQLLDMGIITDEEFQSKKTDLLK